MFRVRDLVNCGCCCCYFVVFHHLQSSSRHYEVRSSLSPFFLPSTNTTRGSNACPATYLQNFYSVANQEVTRHVRFSRAKSCPVDVVTIAVWMNTPHERFVGLVHDRRCGTRAVWSRLYAEHETGFENRARTLWLAGRGRRSGRCLGKWLGPRPLRPRCCRWPLLLRLLFQRRLAPLRSCLAQIPFWPARLRGWFPSRALWRDRCAAAVGRWHGSIGRLLARQPCTRVRRGPVPHCALAGSLGVFSHVLRLLDHHLRITARSMQTFMSTACSARRPQCVCYGCMRMYLLRQRTLKLCLVSTFFTAWDSTLFTRCRTCSRSQTPLLCKEWSDTS